MRRSALSRISASVFVLTCVPAIAWASETAPGTTEAARKPNQIITIAGTGEAGYSGDGGDALDARLGGFMSIDVGPDGSVYIADRQNDRLRVVDADGVIDTVAGTRARRSPERDVPVAEGWIFSPRNTPQAVAVGDDGTVYVAANESIYRIDPDGTSKVIGGGGEERFDDGEGEDGGPAVGTWIYKPNDVAVDANGNVYIADTNNHRIRKIDTDGTITTVAGGGDRELDDAVGGPATDADAGDVHAVAVDSQGNVYFGQENSYRPVVWKVDRDGVLSVAAGTGVEGFSGDGGPAVDAQLPSPPGGLEVDADDNLYLTGTTPGHVRKVDTDGVITTVGPAISGHDGDVAVDADGNLYVTADAQVRMLARSAEEPSPGADVKTGPDPWAGQEPGTVITVAGNGEAPAPGSRGVVPQLLGEPSRPRSVAVADDGSLVYADPASNRVLRIDAGGAVSTIAGTGEVGFSGDGGPATEAQLSTPSGVGFDADGNLYIADGGNGRVRAVDPSGVITTFAGSGRETDDDEAQNDKALGDAGPATEAVLVNPQDVAIGAQRRVYIADAANRRIRVVDPDGTIRTIAGGGDLWADQANGQPATEASLWRPNAVAVDAGGNVYVTGDRMPSVRKIDPEGILTTVAGDAYLEPGEGGFGGDGGPATQAELNEPGDLAIGPDGALYIADTFNSRVRRVDTDGVITTVAGTGQRRDSGDEGPATAAAVNEPGALAFDADGNLSIAGASSKIRHVDTDGVITTVADLAGDQATGESARAVETPLGGPLGIAVDPAGALYVAETQTGIVRRVDPDGTVGSMASVSDHVSNDPINVADVAYGTDDFLYVAAGNMVLRVYPDGAVVTVAGGGISQEPPETLPQATTAALAPAALAAGPDGSLYIADAQHKYVYRLDRDGTLTNLGGQEGISFQGSMAVDDDGNAYLTDQFGNAVHKVAPDGTVSVFAGTSDTSYDPDNIGDGGTAAEAAVISPRSVAVDGDDVYISSLHGIRRVDSNGTITTVVESPSEENDGVTRYEPADRLAFDAHGNLYISETQRNQVQVLVRPGEIGRGLTPTVPIAGVVVLIAAGAFVVVRRRRRAASDIPPSSDASGAEPTPVDSSADARRG